MILKGGNELFKGKKNETKTINLAEKPDYRALTDSELLSYIAEKDEDAFSEIVKRYEKFVFSSVFAELKHEDDTFDTSQEVFIRLWNAAGSFRCESTLKTWLYRMCKNCAYDYMRKFYKHKTISLTRLDNDGEITETDIEEDCERSPEQTAISNERQRMVRKAIQDLPEEQREVIVLREIEEMPYSDIANLLGISEGTVKSRISRGREALKKALVKYIQ